MFELDPRLDTDTLPVTNLSLCTVRLMNDSQFPWLILIPRVAGISEIIDLSDSQQNQLWQESKMISHVLRKVFSPDKLNVAALGNVVSQLHVHHVARMQADCAWPAPVWGRQPTVPYDEDTAQAMVLDIKRQIDRETA